MEGIGILSLVAPIVVILLAIKTKKIFETLIIGTFVALLLLDGPKSFFMHFVDNIYVMMTNEDNIYILASLLLLGPFFKLLENSNGLLKVAQFLAGKCKSSKSALFSVYILGIIVFIDDYLNALVLGSTMRPVTDKYKVPREMLACVTNCTGVPVCTLIPLSTYAIFYASVCGTQPELAAFGENGMGIYISALPFIFYPIVALVIVPLLIMGKIPIVGKMKEAYKRVETNGQLWSDLSSEMNVETSNIEDNSGSAWFFVIPMIVLVTLTFVYDLLVAVIVATFVIALMVMITKKMNYDQVTDCIQEGMVVMLPMVLIIVGAFLFKEAVLETGLVEFVVDLLVPIVSANLLPMITFIVVFLIVFATSSSYAVPAVAMAIIIPLAVAVDANLLLTTGAIFAGGAGGVHACLYSDATVVTSSACRINVLDHTFSQLPYALLIAGISLIGYLVMGFVI
ncbi:hypothetical protein EZV73_21495 [Acidaminobacter sp. JC074]|uniref:Na+/H+ antiporter NhaC family protein n=1 Tax=Acidaminobacter sp. JC074 TaxID=2530199 RepID=UPI001F0D5F1B|nr:Na+/H+ antiporter NhaC family protein [Acidaminobacter sp. JC074]MCH4890170.1 hypothetical protein [Acidaminobacter sp. JC074]